MSKVCLDPGHGGSDPGASGNGIVEKVHVLEFTKSVQKHLLRHNVDVIMTRTNDSYVGLSERANIANRNNVDVFVSIHDNSASASARGVETFTYGKGSNEIRLADCTHGQLISDKFYYSNRGVKQENFAVLRETAMAAILIELGFISNADEAKFLTANTEAMAKSVAKGILRYINIAWIEERPYGTRDVYVNGKITCTSNKVSEVLAAVEKGLATTADIKIVM